MAPEDRHYYELIREGTPCRAYLDVEFARSTNFHVDGESMMQVLRNLLHCHAQHHLILRICRIVELESSTPWKFSRHLILHLGVQHTDAPGEVLFPAGNHQVGSWIRGLWTMVELLAGSDSLQDDARLPPPFEGFTRDQLRQLLVRNEAGDAYQSCIDMGMYTRNRNFRLALSSKISKLVPLVPIADGFDTQNYVWFADTLVCPPADMVRPLSSSQLGQIANLPLFAIGQVKGEGVRSSPEHFTLRLGFQERRRDAAIPTAESARSAFPELNASLRAYLTSVTLPRGPAIAVAPLDIQFKSINHFPDSHTLVYSILGSRFCHRIGREHKSNAVYYVVDTRDGVCTQRCFDPDCLHYRSPSIPLLGADMCSVQEWDFTEGDADADTFEELVDPPEHCALTDADLIRAVEEVEQLHPLNHAPSLVAHPA
jgi:DNA-directed primase/polymerase protein